MPALMLVRDPIENLKHGALPCRELLENIKDLQRVFTLSFDYHYFNKILRLRGREYEPPLSFLGLKTQTAIWDSLVNALKPKDLVYVDMQEISKERAFETLTKLSQHFGFNAPQEKDRKIYEAKHFNGNLFFLWSNQPLTLCVNRKDLPYKYSKNSKKKNNENFSNVDLQNSFKIYFIFPEKIEGYVDIAQHFEGEIRSQICVYMREAEFNALCEDVELWNATKEYVNEFLEYLETELKLAQNERVTTEQVLEALSKNQASLQSLESVLEPELKHIKKHRPDIVESWKYYKEFQKMCKKSLKNKK
ncbi:DUF2972 domain-containing protein [Helicobacter sp. MIT 11-5569]|uniref:DUF2972 domain-containing protein n=1 Tax=Helicobacter sp. MIT 11-5569 TaxID=1548151 RepID=UPI00051F9C4F|nr:DUF2972 domain-containing protein [Helicobacter sp. MIT 11-5569]TLD80301.1 DUF2972 domain-containing protein [Helicobacter sp. MIT 11-5569]